MFDNFLHLFHVDSVVVKVLSGVSYFNIINHVTAADETFTLSSKQLLVHNGNMVIETDPIFLDSPADAVVSVRSEDGSVVDAKVLKSLGNVGCDEAAIEAAKAQLVLSHDVGCDVVRVFPNQFHREVPHEKTIARSRHLWM